MRWRLRVTFPERGMASADYGQASQFSAAVFAVEICASAQAAHLPKAVRAGDSVAVLLNDHHFFFFEPLQHGQIVERA